jgi:hypothetical protein
VARLCESGCQVLGSLIYRKSQSMIGMMIMSYLVSGGSSSKSDRTALTTQGSGAGRSYVSKFLLTTRATAFDAAARTL